MSTIASIETLSPSDRLVGLSGFLPTFLLTLLATLVMSAPNLADPMIRWDDYPALLGDASLFWSKTLHEGRWLNYIWHLRDWLAPAWLNFLVYQVSWAAFGAGLASVVFSRDDQTLMGVLLAVAIVVSPSAMLISLWFNTLIPGLALVALYAVVANYVSAKAMTWLLPVFVIVTFTAYTIYPLLLLAVCLLRQERKSLPRLIGLLALFTVSIIAAVLLTYVLNWYVHGIFGVPLGDWRAATPAGDVGGYFGNLAKLSSAGANIITAVSLDFLPGTIVHVALALVAAVVLVRHNPMLALYLYAGLFTGLVMVGAQVLKVGVEVPARAFMYVWVFHWVAIAFATAIFSKMDGLMGRFASKAVMFLVGFQLLINVQHYSKYRPWQAETAEIGRQIAEITGPIYVMNHPASTPVGEKANIQSNFALMFRLQQVAGVKVSLCAEDPVSCAHLVNVPVAEGGIAIVDLPNGQGRAVIYPIQEPGA